MFNHLFHLGKIIVNGILVRENVVAVSSNMSNLALKHQAVLHMKDIDSISLMQILVLRVLN